MQLLMEMKCHTVVHVQSDWEDLDERTEVNTKLWYKCLELPRGITYNQAATCSINNGPAKTLLKF